MSRRPMGRRSSPSEQAHKDKCNRLMQRARAGDRTAIHLLSKKPYFLRIIPKEEWGEYEQ